MDRNIFIDLNTVISRNDSKFLANKLGDELVMMDLKNGDFVSMNNVGADIWSLTEQPVTVKELIRKLMDIYDIPQEVCINETTQFLQKSIGEHIFDAQNVVTE